MRSVGPGVSPIPPRGSRDRAPRGHLGRLAAAALLALLAAPSPGGQLPLERLGPEDGLPHNTVNDILQDREGFLWLGTDGGLSRYDGYGFTNLRRVGVGNVVLRLLEDSRGRLWVGTESGLWTLERATESLGDADLGAAGYCGALLEDGRGRIWAGVGAEVHRTAPDDRIFRPVPLPGPPFERVWSLAETPTGEIWAVVGASTGLELELRRIDGEHSADERIPVTGRFHTHLSVDSTGSLWVGPLEPSSPSGPALPTRRPGLDAYLNDVAEIDPHRFWLATNQGLFHYDVSRDELERHPISASSPTWQSEHVVSLLVDRHGGLWVGTLGGLYHHDPHAKRFRHWGHDPRDPTSLSADPISEIVAGSGGELWISTYGGGLNRFDPGTGAFRRYRHDPADPSSLPSDVVWALAWDETDGLLWIGAGRTTVLDPATGRFRTRSLPIQSPEGDPPVTAHALLAEPSGPIWVASYRRGLFAGHRDGTWDHWPELSANHLLATDPDTLWVAQLGSVSRLDRTSGRSERFPLRSPEGRALVDVEVFDLCRLENETWLATTAGLGLLADGDTAATVPIAAGELPGSVVFSLVPDEEGTLWMGTNQGLVRFDPTGTPGRRTRVYSSNDGTGNVEYNRSARYVAPDGTIYLGGMSGLTAFRPEEIRDNPVVPPVLLTDVRTLGPDGEDRLDPRALELLELSPETVAVTFGFTALSFTRSEANRYAYRLDGFDADWVDGGGGRSARYTNLPPGSYTFRVRGANNDGVWNPADARLAVVVLPPLWQTWWFRSLAFLLLVSLLVALHRIRVRRLIELERVRLRIAGDLHDELGSELSGIALASARLAARSPPDDPARGRLEELRSSALRVMQGLRDIVWSVSPDHDNFQSTEARLRAAARSLLEGVDTTLDFDLPEGERPLEMEVRRGLYLIFRELLVNIGRHAGASSVRISLRQDDRELQLTVEDDGRGFDPQATTDGTGLASIRRRAANLGADLEIDSSPGSGTRIRLRRKMTSIRQGRLAGIRRRIEP